MLSSVLNTVNFIHDGTWGDLLTGYNGKTITSDTTGNMLSDDTWTSFGSIAERKPMATGEYKR